MKLTAKPLTNRKIVPKVTGRWRHCIYLNKDVCGRRPGWRRRENELRQPNWSCAACDAVDRAGRPGPLMSTASYLGQCYVGI